jgi:hypothetical protein
MRGASGRLPTPITQQRLTGAKEEDQSNNGNGMTNLRDLVCSSATSSPARLRNSFSGTMGREPLAWLIKNEAIAAIGREVLCSGVQPDTQRGHWTRRASCLVSLLQPL